MDVIAPSLELYFIKAHGWRVMDSAHRASLTQCILLFLNARVTVMSFLIDFIVYFGDDQKEDSREQGTSI